MDIIMLSGAVLLLLVLCFMLIGVLGHWLKKPKVTADEEISSSQLIYETVEGSHQFKIKGYSLAKGMGNNKSMESAKFTVGGYDWVILFYPDGDFYADGGIYPSYVSVSLKLVSPTEVRASLASKLLDQSGKGIHSLQNFHDPPRTFNKDHCSWGFSKYMKRSELEASDYLKDDCLIIDCTVRVVTTRVETVQTRLEEKKHYDILVPPSNMIQNLKSLLDSEIGSDVTFQVGNKFFRAHKSILAVRSPVFRAQFFGMVGDPDKETVVIEELDPLAFKAMLQFLYSDELPETRELSDLDSPHTTITIIQHLLAAADRFDLARFKVMCEAKLCEEITTNTVAAILALAELHQCMQLKHACLNFAAKPTNLKEVMTSDGYAHLENSLLKDLLKTSAVVNEK